MSHAAAAGEPLVSVVIPCRDAGEHIEEAISSALAQTHGAIEVIVVDDGSTDPNTVALLDASSWPQNVQVLRQENKGPSAARNAAIRVARGAYILPLDADDIIEPTYVAKASSILESRDDVGIVYCLAEKFGVETGAWILPDYSLDAMVADNVIFCTAMFRRGDWAKTPGYNERLRHGMEDYDLWIKLLELGREVVRIDEVLFYYRTTKDSRTTRFAADDARIHESYAEVFRSNIGFFSRHAEILVRQRLDAARRLLHFQGRYRKLDAVLQRHAWILALAKAINRLFPGA